MATKQIYKRTRRQRIDAFERVIKTARNNGLVVSVLDGVVTLMHPEVQQAKGIVVQCCEPNRVVEVPEEFSQMFRQLRQDAGLSQNELADRVGISFSYLSKIEHGRSEPAEEVMRRLAEELSQVLGEDEIALFHEMMLKAGKVPSDISRSLLDRPDILRSLRNEA